MRLRFLQTTLFTLVFLVLPVAAHAQTQNGITETQLTAFVDSIDNAAKKGNVAGILAPLARDVKIRMTVTMPNSNEEKVVTLTKSQYALISREAMRRKLSYTYLRKNTRFKIYEGATTASVTSDVYETLTVKEGTLRSVSSEVAIVTLRNGKLLITSLEGRTRFY